MSRRVMALATPRIHHDALDWVRRVVAQGGSCSQSTLRAVSGFCDAIDRAGIRDRFFRVNLFCGNSDASLVAVRTPLYRGPSLDGTQYGGTTDTNVNFVAGDYAETGASGGLQGNGSTKRLDTGLNASVLPSAADMHLAAWKSAGTVTSGRVFVGVRDTSATNLFRVFKGPNTGGYLDTFLGLLVSAVSASGAAANDDAGMIIGSRTSATSLALFRNGSSVGNNSTSAAGTLPARPFFVFADNQSSGAAEFWPHRISAYSIGMGLTSTQAADYYAALNTFMGALSRT